MEISQESKKYIFLLGQLGIQVNVEQDCLQNNKYRIGKTSVYKDELESRLKNLYQDCKNTRKSIQKISHYANRMQFEVNFNSWQNLDNQIDF
jgi:hypothetical protein